MNASKFNPSVRFAFLLLASLGVIWNSRAQSSDANAGDSAPKVLLIGLDGVYLKTIEERHLPFLELFSQTSAVATNVQSLYTLEEFGKSLPEFDRFNWTSLLTGVWAVEEPGNSTPAEPSVPSLIDVIESRHPEKTTLVLSSRKDIADDLVARADVVHFPGGSSGSYLAADQQLAAEAKQRLKTGNPDLTFLYFGSALAVLQQVGFDLDHPRYLSAVQDLDAMFGEIVTEVFSREFYPKENWLILLVNSHYFHRDGASPESPFQSFIMANGKNILPGRLDQPARLVDVFPTVLAQLEGSFAPGPELDGRVMAIFTESKDKKSPPLLEPVMTSLQQLVKSNEQGVNRILQRQQESEAKMSSQTENLINRNVAALNQHIERLSREWKDQRANDLQSIRESNQLTILIVGLLFAVTLLGALFSMWMQARAMKNLSTIVSALPGHSMIPPPNGRGLKQWGSAEDSPERLLNTIDRLERRILELESSFDDEYKEPYPKIHPELFEENKPYF